MSDNNIFFAVIITTVTILFLLIGLIAIMYSSYRQRLKQQMVVADMQLNYEKELRKVEAEVSDSMMERFGQELHDNIGHILTQMRLQIENKKLDDPTMDTAFKPIENSLNEATEQLKLLSRSLNTDYIANIGLEEAIDIEVSKLVQLRRLQVQYNPSEESISLDKNKELMTFRIFQEILHNTLKHSRAKHIYISILPETDILLQVKDDGKGFNLEKVMKSPSASGLRNMIKRAALADMQCVIETSPGEGCTYTLHLQPTKKETTKTLMI